MLPVLLAITYQQRVFEQYFFRFRKVDLVNKVQVKFEQHVHLQSYTFQLDSYWLGEFIFNQQTLNLLLGLIVCRFVALVKSWK